MRIGQGFDIHRLEEGLELVIGGVKIPYHKGFVAHSDGDILYHALIDAIFGSLALGDIGYHFPDNDPKYKGVNSEILLKKACDILASNGYKIINIDSTICAQEPKMRPYIDDMRKNISRILNIDLNQVSVKAKTNEKMDSIGACLAISANVVILVDKI